MKNNYLNYIKKLYISEKSSFLFKKRKILVLLVDKKINKLNIHYYISKFFNVKIIKIRTLLVKKRIVSKFNKNGLIKIFKKAYVYLDKNQNIVINK